MGEIRTNGGEAVIQVMAGEYMVDAEAPGYQRAMARTRMLSSGPTEVRMYLTALKREEGEEAGASGVVMSPALKKEMDKASSALSEKNLAEARKHLKKAQEIAPSNPEVLYLMGVVEYTDKDKVAAEKEFQEVLSRYPNHAGSLLMLGQIMLESGRKQDAVPLLERAVEASPTKWLPNELLAFAYARTGQLDKALVQAEKTEGLNKDRVAAMRLLEAKILAKQGKTEEEKARLKTIIEQYPNDPAAKSAQELLAGVSGTSQQATE